MSKYLYIFLALFFLTACESSVTSSSDGDEKDLQKEEIVNIEDTSDEVIPDETIENEVDDPNEHINNDFIESIPYDTIEHTDIAQVPHRKSTIPMLGILISYNNIQISSSISSWSAKLFGKSEHQLNHYYAEVSNSQFEFEKANETNGITNDGIVSVTLNRDHPDTDIDKSYFSSKMHPDLRDALIAVDNDIDFSNYDTDANGHITPDELLFTFIIAGYEDSYQGWHVTNGVWANKGCTDYQFTPTLDGVTLMNCQYNGNFAMFGEQHDIYNPHIATIGIIAHELGHSAFALPDLYNTSGSDSGIGIFGLMAAGSWSKQNRREEAGNTPTHFSAWSKVYMGWSTPIEESGSVSLTQTTSEDYNIIKIPISTNNYYLLENRNNSGYDKGLYSLDGTFNGGVAIWHINEEKLTLDNFLLNNVNNDTSNKGVDLVEAQETYIDFMGDGGEKALFYSPYITSFGTKVTDISTRGSVMNLNIN